VLSSNASVGKFHKFQTLVAIVNWNFYTNILDMDMDNYGISVCGAIMAFPLQPKWLSTGL